MPPKRRIKSTDGRNYSNPGPAPKPKPMAPSTAHGEMISMMRTPDPKNNATRLSTFDNRGETIEHLNTDFFPKLQESYRIPGPPDNRYLLHIEPHITKEHDYKKDPLKSLQNYFNGIDMKKFRLYGPELMSPDQLMLEGKKHVVPSPLEYVNGFRVYGDSMRNITPHVSTPRPKARLKIKSKRKKKKTRKKKKRKQGRKKKTR